VLSFGSGNSWFATQLEDEGPLRRDRLLLFSSRPVSRSMELKTLKLPISALMLPSLYQLLPWRYSW
jgi:hypothetical protein